MHVPPTQRSVLSATIAAGHGEHSLLRFDRGDRVRYRDHQAPTVERLTLRPPNRVQNGPALNTAKSSKPSARPSQQLKKLMKARQVDLLKTRVVVLAEL